MQAGTERRRKAQEGLVEGIALAAACIAAGLFQRFVGQRHQLLQKEDELVLAKEALVSAQHALKACAHERDDVKCRLTELRGELGSSKSELESMRRELLLHKRSLDSVHSQLDDRDYELRSSRANGYWTSNGEGD